MSCCHNVFFWYFFSSLVDDVPLLTKNYQRCMTEVAHKIRWAMSSSLGMQFNITQDAEVLQDKT